MLIVWSKIPQIPQNLSADLSVCPSSKVWDITGKASCGVRTPCYAASHDWVETFRQHSFSCISLYIIEMMAIYYYSRLNGMVFCLQNCSDLLWEKNVLVSMKNFWNSRLKAENLQKRIIQTVVGQSNLLNKCILTFSWRFLSNNTLEQL